jgi:DNA/RNA endonuclease YhcR with UshA esterase domain
MRYIIMGLISAIGIAVFFITSAQSESITPQQASKYVGRTVTVEGVVSQVSTTGGGSTFINFGGRYPNHVFYAVLFRKYQTKFSGTHALLGQTVAISGKIEMHKGKPQIKLISPDQIGLR